MNENLLDKQFEKHNIDISTYKKDTRFIWDKIIVTSGIIIGFSISMASSFQTMLNVNLLKASWIIFLINILQGLVLLILDSKRTLQISTENAMLTLPQSLVQFLS